MGALDIYKFEAPREASDGSEQIQGVWVTLPSGLSAWFLRTHYWGRLTPISKSGEQLEIPAKVVESQEPVRLSFVRFPENQEQ